jgi:hypothetical protein
MIIKDKGLVEAQYIGDKFVFTHAQNIDPVLAEVQRFRNDVGDGFTQDRTMRHVGCIPEIEFLRHPEWVHAPHLMLKWLQTDGSQYMTKTINSGRSGHVRVK